MGYILQLPHCICTPMLPSFDSRCCFPSSAILGFSKMMISSASFCSSCNPSSDWLQRLVCTLLASTQSGWRKLSLLSYHMATVFQELPFPSPPFNFFKKSTLSYNLAITTLFLWNWTNNSSLFLLICRTTNPQRITLFSFYLLWLL